MSQAGYSTVLDAILFLAFVSVCAAVLSPAIFGHPAERASADRGLREISADALLALEHERVDSFEYRILGDAADKIAGMGGINATSDILYRDVTKALLGRGSRHKTAMSIAAESAACQFIAGQGDTSLRLNPITAEYDKAVQDLVDRSVRAHVDRRYSYEFSLRWAPFAGVPIYGEARAGRPHPPGAASSQAAITLPYMTNITAASLDGVNGGDLDRIDRAIELYRARPDENGLRDDVRQALAGCLKNTTREAVGEIWNNTLGSIAARDGPLDPLQALKRFSNNETLNEQVVIAAGSCGEGLVEEMVLAASEDDLDMLAETIVAGVRDGAMDGHEARLVTVAWLKSRYQPSKALATLSVWVDPYDQ
jgi:hypothetical protein